MRIPKNATALKLHLLRYAEEKEISCSEIAKRIGLNVKTVRNLLYTSTPLRMNSFLEFCEVLCDTREEYEALIMAAIKQTPEYMFTERRLRWKEKNDNQ